MDFIGRFYIRLRFYVHLTNSTTHFFYRSIIIFYCKNSITTNRTLDLVVGFLNLMSSDSCLAVHKDQLELILVQVKMQSLFPFLSFPLFSSHCKKKIRLKPIMTANCCYQNKRVGIGQMDLGVT